MVVHKKLEDYYEYAIAEVALSTHDLDYYNYNNCLNTLNTVVISKEISNKTEKNMKQDFKIKDYKECDNNGVKTVVVYFEDGDRQHAVCCSEDTYDLERGIEVCVMKHIFGADEYKLILKKAMRQVKAIDKAKEDEKKLKEEIAKKKAKSAKRKAKRRAKQRQARIDEMKEAYLAAMKECSKEKEDKASIVDDFNEILDRLVEVN